MQNRVTTTKVISATALAERVGRLASRWCLAAGRIEEVGDGLRGENSPFAKAILSFLQTNTDTKFPASVLVQHVKRVTPNNAKQTPIGGVLFKVNDLGGEFVFELKKDKAADWIKAAAENTVESYQFFLAIHPTGEYVSAAQDKVEQFQAESTWMAIQNAKEEQLWEVQNKIQKIKQFIRKYEDTEQYQLAIALGKEMEIKARFIKAKPSYFDLLTFSKEETFYQEAAIALLKQMDEAEYNQDKEAAQKQTIREKAIAVQKAEALAMEEQRKKETELVQLKKEQRLASPTKDEDLQASIKKRLNEDMVFVIGGTFTMGCTAEQDNCNVSEKPAHQVKLKDFYIDRYEVTNEQYAAFLNAVKKVEDRWIELDGKYKNEKCRIYKSGQQYKVEAGYEKHPVIYVSWFGAKEYATFYAMRLPTEAEWEFAARGGNDSKVYQYSGGNILNDVAWNESNSKGKIHAVGSRRKNELVL